MYQLREALTSRCAKYRTSSDHRWESTLSVIISRCVEAGPSFVCRASQLNSHLPYSILGFNLSSFDSDTGQYLSTPCTLLHDDPLSRPPDLSAPTPRRVDLVPLLHAASRAAGTLCSNSDTSRVYTLLAPKMGDINRSPLTGPGHVCLA